MRNFAVGVQVSKSIRFVKGQPISVDLGIEMESRRRPPRPILESACTSTSRRTLTKILTPATL
jgi:hypothetical protein